jgi:hypothetical protein
VRGLQHDHDEVGGFGHSNVSGEKERRKRKAPLFFLVLCSRIRRIALLYAYARFASGEVHLRVNELQRRCDVNTDTKMGPIAEAWFSPGDDHRGARRAVGYGCVKSGQKFPGCGEVQIPDCCPFNADSNSSGLPRRLRDEQCRTATLCIIGAIAKQTPKLGPLLRVTCNIKSESAVANDDRATGLLVPMRK